jgi:hypothetical protein
MADLDRLAPNRPTRSRPAPSGPAPSAGDPSAAARLLALQGQAGNAAVAGMVQRQPEDEIEMPPMIVRPGASEPDEIEMPPMDVRTGGEATAGPAATVADTTPQAPAGANPLVGLKKGDGLNTGTTALQPRVKLLQHRLDETTGAGLNVDGKWGDKTQAALESFMLTRNTVPGKEVDQPTGDALMGTSPGPGPGPGPGPKPGEDAPFNPHVESRLEAVVEEYRLIFELQKDALHRLETDLATIEKDEPGIFQELLVKAVNAIMEKFIGVSLDELVKALNELGPTITGDQKKAASDGALGGIDKLVAGAMEQRIKDQNKGVDDVGLFVESQLQGATEATGEVTSKFLTTTKPAMSKLNAGETATSDAADPRVARAEALRQKVKKSRVGSFQAEYDEALAKWTVYLAQKKGGVTTVDGKEGTDLSDKGIDAAAPGLLVVEIDAGKPGEGIKIDKVHITGLSERVRDRLDKGDHSFDALGFPAKVQGDVDDPNGDLELARNEAGTEFIDNDTDDDGKTWLMQRLKLRNGQAPPDGALKETIENAAHIVLDEVLAERTSKHKVEKG